MRVQEQIEIKLKKVFNPEYFEVRNESHKHNVPPGSESHFKLVIVSDAFNGRGLRERHQMVYQALDEEMSNSIHALSLQVKTPEQWGNSEKQIQQTPVCRGGTGL